MYSYYALASFLLLLLLCVCVCVCVCVCFINYDHFYSVFSRGPGVPIPFIFSIIFTCFVYLHLQTNIYFIVHYS